MLDELLARENIRDCLARYCQGLDRSDAELAKSAYWPDATENHAGVYEGLAHPYTDMVIAAFRDFRPGWKLIGNSLIRIDGNNANVESYVFASQTCAHQNGKVRDVLVGGRYLDHMQCRGSEWRIFRRLALSDWYRETEPYDYSAGCLGNQVRSGSPYPNDPVNTLFKGKLSISGTP
jgi:hypothetical protein